MATYKIPECNLEALENKLATISKKCNKYGCDFTFTKVSEVVENIAVRNEYPVYYKFIIVDVIGTAKVNNWLFLATIEHTTSGNIIRQYNNDVSIPESYRTVKPHCEHCNTDRYRKDTYLVYNELTQEIKQLGKSCLKDYTDGLSAEMVASYLQYFVTCENFESSDFSSSGKKYYNAMDILNASIEIINNVGFVSKAKSEEEGKESTKSIVMKCLHPVNKYDLERIEKVGYTGANQDTESVIKWLYGKESNNDYIYNLQVIMKQEYIEYRNIGFVVSLYASYYKDIQKIEEQKKQEFKNNLINEYYGNVSDKVVLTGSIEQIASYETMYGITHVFKIISNGYTFIWKTANSFEKSDNVTIKGTIKAHNDFRGTKQTELTRCKVS